MYAPHFGLTQDPFSIAPDPRFLFMSQRHREALAHLLFGVGGGEPGAGQAPSLGTGGGFVLLTGDIGTGKTTVCRCFLAQVQGKVPTQGPTQSRAHCRMACIFNPKLTVPELLQTIAEEFHIPPQPAALAGAEPSVKAHIDALNAFLLRCHAAGERCVLVIDEAQNLSAGVLEQLRLLTNLETDEHKLLQIILIGQPELRTLLAQPALEQLSQRVIARCHLGPLAEAETAQYVAHRLAMAGHSGPPLFGPAALRRVHRLSGGVPRRINLLCGRALLGAWTLGQHPVSAPVVNRAAQEVFDNAPHPHGGAAPPHRALAALAVLAVATALALAAWTSTTAPHSPWPGTQPRTPAEAAPHATPTPLASLLPELPTDAAPAWRTLAPHWRTEPVPVADKGPAAQGQPADTGDPCPALAAQGLLCHRTTQLSLPLLRQLDRQGILTLQADSGPERHAVLLALGEHTATLGVNGRTHTVPLAQLLARWRGGFATLWQPPPGFGERLLSGATGPAVAQLSQRLAAWGAQPGTATGGDLGGGEPPTLNAALHERVRHFQAVHGLTPDGRPGPMTFMQLERATGSTAPRLSRAATP